MDFIKEFTPALTAILAIVSPIIAFLGIKYNNKNMLKRQTKELRHIAEINYKTTISPMRQKWVNDLRDCLSEFIGVCSVIKTSQDSNPSNIEIVQSNFAKMHRLNAKLQLLLNPKKHKQILINIVSTTLLLDSRKYSKEQFKKNLEALIEESQKVLKKEWERIKKGD